jgi:hypothetical protein
MTAIIFAVIAVVLFLVGALVGHSVGYSAARSVQTHNAELTADLLTARTALNKISGGFAGDPVWEAQEAIINIDKQQKEIA